jgi:hypothetical protein
VKFAFEDTWMHIVDNMVVWMDLVCQHASSFAAFNNDIQQETTVWL